MYLIIFEYVYYLHHIALSEFDFKNGKSTVEISKYG